MLANLPRDVIITIALTMDLPEILSWCNTSKRFNDILCLNNTFWYNKLKHDYDIDYKAKYEVKLYVPVNPNVKIGPFKLVVREYGPRKYYEYIRESLIDGPQRSLVNAGIESNLDKMKAAVTQGADINELSTYGRHILYYPLTWGDLEMAKYIVNHPTFNRTSVPDLLNPKSLVDHIKIDDNNKEVYNYLISQGILKP